MLGSLPRGHHSPTRVLHVLRTRSHVQNVCPPSPKYINTNAYVSFLASANPTFQVPPNSEIPGPTHTILRVWDHIRDQMDYPECLAQTHHH